MLYRPLQSHKIKRGKLLKTKTQRTASCGNSDKHIFHPQESLSYRVCAEKYKPDAHYQKCIDMPCLFYPAAFFRSHGINSSNIRKNPW